MTATQPPSMDLVEVPVPDAARRLGISAETVRRRVRSGDMTGTSHVVNGKRALLVQIPATATPGPESHAARTDPATSSNDAHTAAWQAHVATLTDQIERLEANHRDAVERLQASHTASIERLDATYRDALERLHASHVATLAHLERLTLAANRRPFWRFW